MSAVAPPVLTPTDAELLMRFAEHRDEEAFRLLVARYARLVRTVCRRVLWREQDVEDAWQAVFLVLARSAPAIRRRTSVAGWLFQVAHRTASRAAVRRLRTKEEPLAVEPEIPSQALARLQHRETFEILAAELNRLPENYRTPLVLLYLEGKSHEAAAEELECTDAALKGRLARGRHLLRERLARSGVALSLVLGSWTAGSSVTSAADGTTVAALHYLTSGTAGPACSADVVSLAEGVLRMKSLALTKTTVAAGLLLVGLLAGMGAGLHQLVAGPRAENAAAGEAVINAEAAHVPSEEGATEPAVLALAEADAAATDSVPADEKRTGFNIVPRNRDAAAEDPSAGGSVESATAETDESVPDTTAFDQGLAPQSAGSDPAWVDLKSRTAPEQRIVAALADPAVEVLFVDIPLKDAMDFLADAHDITIYIDEQALQDEGITSDQPLDATLKEIELRSVLNLILEPLGLTWIIEDEVLKVTTRSVADERLETRVYPLAHLLSGGRDMESLQQALKNSTAMYTGGDEPEMVWVGSSLVATTSQPAHRRMAELLEQLTRAAEMSENRPTAPVR